MIKDNEKGERIYRKLLYYFENQTPVHINSIFGFRNGLIFDLSKIKLVVMIKDKKETSPILLEDIYEDSIDEFKEMEEWIDEFKEMEE